MIFAKKLKCNVALHFLQQTKTSVIFPNPAMSDNAILLHHPSDPMPEPGSVVQLYPDELVPPDLMRSSSGQVIMRKGDGAK